MTDSDRGIPEIQMPPLEKVVELSAAQRRQLEQIEARAIVGFQGDFADLASALGMLRLGPHFGWRVMYLVHGKATVQKYESILGVQVHELFPENGPSSERSRGLRLSSTVSSFWKIVSGEVKIPDRAEIDR